MLDELLQQPESKVLEFKRDISSLEPILKTIVAFANTAGGTLIIGRSPDGASVGVKDIFRAEEALANSIADSIRPSLLPDIEIASVGEVATDGSSMRAKRVYPNNFSSCLGILSVLLY